MVGKQNAAAKGIATFTWKVANYSNLSRDKGVVSRNFQHEGIEWYVDLYPGGASSVEGTHMSMALSCVEYVIPARKITYEFVVVDPSGNYHHVGPLINSEYVNAIAGNEMIWPELIDLDQLERRFINHDELTLQVRFYKSE